MADKKVVLVKGNHTVTTTVPAEVHQLRAAGYVEEKPKPKTVEPAKTDKK